MSLTRIKGVLLQELFITKRSLEVIMDLFFFSIISTIVFGFVSIYLTKTVSASASSYLLLGILLWEIVRITQYSMSVGALWNIWSRNLSNMFISPLTIREYLFAMMISGLVKALVTFTLISLIALLLFEFNIFKVGFTNLSFFFINLVIFSWSLGIALLAVVFRFGTRIQALAWGLVFLFQPLTAAFFPVKILPPILREITYIFPPTFVFEAAREALSSSGINWQMSLIAFLQNIIYFYLSILFFNFMYKKSKQSGQFARNEG